MNRQDCKIGMRVIVKNYVVNNRRRIEKTGKILNLYDRFALVKIDEGYNECFFYRDISMINDEVKEDGEIHK